MRKHDGTRKPEMFGWLHMNLAQTRTLCYQAKAQARAGLYKYCIVATVVLM
jgi:hypothetical protein